MSFFGASGCFFRFFVLQFRRGKMDIEWLVAAMREANSFLTTPTVVVNEPALVRRHRGVRGLDGDLFYPYPATSA